MLEYILLILIVGLLVLSTSDRACMIISHYLNIICRLPHPGPNDIQGACWCRRYEGLNKHTFGDYCRSLFKRR